MDPDVQSSTVDMWERQGCTILLCSDPRSQTPQASSTAKHTVLVYLLATNPFIDWFSMTGAFLHRHGISVLSYFDLCSKA